MFLFTASDFYNECQAVQKQKYAEQLRALYKHKNPSSVSCELSFNPDSNWETLAVMSSWRIQEQKKAQYNEVLSFRLIPIASR